MIYDHSSPLNPHYFQLNLVVLYFEFEFKRGQLEKKKS
jgi:hypothetical protein